MHDHTCKVETLSVPPVTSENHRQRFWTIPYETEGNITYNYVPIINLPALRNIFVFIYSFFKVILWSLSQSGKNKIIICDALALSVTAASILAGKLTRTRHIAIITDLPNFMILGAESKPNMKQRIYNKVVSFIIPIFDGYILLTSEMNKLANRQHKPHMIMEGLVDIKMTSHSNSLGNKASKRILIYAGGIYEIYGIKKLIEAFMRLESDDLQLHIYGAGDLEKDMPRYMNLDSRIIYHGTVSNQVVVQKELEATLLINPRSSKEEFTKYSFPSKNMEYMVSGTPLLTTPLLGMPQEYNQYVYLFDDESVEGLYATLKILLDKSCSELYEFGHAARQFVLEHKSNYKQTRRILDFLETLTRE